MVDRFLDLGQEFGKGRRVKVAARQFLHQAINLARDFNHCRRLVLKQRNDAGEFSYKQEMSILATFSDVAGQESMALVGIDEVIPLHVHAFADHLLGM
jgi:hypothetical protein